MSNVQFNEEQEYAPVRTESADSKGLTGIIMKLGLAQDAKGATRVLFCVLIVAVVLSAVAILLSMNASPEPPPLPPKNMPLPGLRR